MSRIIRKLTVGNYKSQEAMHFQVGNPVGLKGGDVRHAIDRIKFLDKLHYDTGREAYEIFVSNPIDGTVKCWKTIRIGKNDTAFEEYDLDF